MQGSVVLWAALGKVREREGFGKVRWGGVERDDFTQLLRKR